MSAEMDWGVGGELGPLISQHSMVAGACSRNVFRISGSDPTGRSNVGEVD